MLVGVYLKQWSAAVTNGNTKTFGYSHVHSVERKYRKTRYQSAEPFGNIRL